MKYSTTLLTIFSVVATTGFICNVAVVACILSASMLTPNVRYVLMLTIALLLEQMFSFPQIFVRYESVCAAAGALETYFQMVMLCAGVCLSILAYLQIFQADAPNRWEWLNKRRVYVSCLILPVCGLLPLIDNSGYGVVGRIWCAALIDTLPGLDWLVVCYAFTYTAVGIMTALFGVIVVKLYNGGDVNMFRNAMFGVGGYVFITILIWVPRIALLHPMSDIDFLVIRLLPDISAVLYAVLYFSRREMLYNFEDDMKVKVSVNAEFRMNSVDMITAQNSVRFSEMDNVNPLAFSMCSTPRASAAEAIIEEGIPRLQSDLSGQLAPVIVTVANENNC